MTKVLIVGGGYAGLYLARKLERKYLKRGEAQVTLVDPNPYMTYQPLLPEVAAGNVEPRHTVVSQRKHLKRTEVITARVTGVDHAAKKATITPKVGEAYEIEYDIIAVTAGAVSRTFPIPGIADNAIGLKNVEEAVAIRDTLINNFGKAAAIPAGPARDRLLTTVVVGGGFAGIEVFAELRSLASSLLKYYPQIAASEVQFHLIEAMDRIMPEVSHKTSLWVLKDLASRDAHVHLNTQVVNAVDGVVETNTGEKYPTDLIIWTAGVMANPMVRTTGLPVEERGRINVGADLRVRTLEGEVVADAFAAGDCAAVPDLTGNGVGGFCVPNAQHAVRQGKLLAKNVAASIRGEEVREYRHDSIGAVAGLGIGRGVYTGGKKKFALKGWIGWVMHRGYHGLAIPFWERKTLLFSNWFWHFFQKRDIVALNGLETPRAAFEEFASRPKA